MGHDKLRNDTECQNCGHEVQQIYCPHCGQKNIETRQSFGHLITHFAEDLTHYDSAFWKTIKYLLFRPARLTIEYLEGKRQKYVPPVKLYIFISFVTFLTLGFLPDDYEAEQHTTEQHNTDHNTKPEVAEESDGPTFNMKVAGIDNEPEDNIIELSNGEKVSSVKQLDSVNALPGKKMPQALYWMHKKQIEINEKNITREKFTEALFHSFPKVLFIYMPIFAFWLWLFHGKKRWYFFDHGIFTLHYFSLLLLIRLISDLLKTLILRCISTDYTITVRAIFAIIFFIYAFVYFFRAHSNMYNEKKYISRIKGLALFIMNGFCILITLTLAVLYTLLTMH